ncbi:MAG: ATP-binding protein [Armatimonadota bacterium]
MPVGVIADAEFQIPAQGKYVALVRKGIRSLAEGAGFDEETCQDIEVAIGEAVTNAVCHGSPTDGSGRVSIRCGIFQSSIEVDVEDNGHAACVPIPKAIVNKNNEHGRGWRIIHSLMDQVSVSCTKKGLLVRMVKQKTKASNVEMPQLAIIAN